MVGGFDIAQARPGRFAQILGDESDAARLRAMGLPVVLLDPSPGRTLSLRADRELGRRRGPSRFSARPSSVPAFGAGSMGGFYTTLEIRAYLDSLLAADTHGLFSRVDTMGWSYRHRPVWCVKMTGPSPGPKPRVFLNSLIHSREPEGMQNLLYFMGRLAGSYGTDPDLTYLLDQREIYFAPLLNPDGYAVNESIYVSTHNFGLWRKNTQDNDKNGILNSQDGVDLNRNFGLKWGVDNIGSSPTRGNDAYRGTAAFSEPETRAIRNLCDSLHFATGINYHTFSDLLLVPYGYTNIMSPDSLAYFEWVDDMGADTHYAYGNAPRLLYNANGVADDWMYGETAEKPRMYSVTIEAGNQDDYFWPAPSRILPLAMEQVKSNMVECYIAGRYLRVQGEALVGGDGFLHAGQRGYLSFAVKNRGLGESSLGTLTATLSSSDNQSAVLDSLSTFGAIAPGATAAPLDSGFTIYLPPSTAAGTVLRFRVRFTDDGGYSGTDSFQVLTGMPTTIFADSAESGMGNWTGGTWGTTATLASSPTHSFTDSPSGYYAFNADNRMAGTSNFDLSGLSNAYLFFWTRWDIEQDYDAGTVEVSADSGATWTALPGRYTGAGAGTSGAFAGGAQPLGAPVYDALKYKFVEERINLSAWCGTGKPPVKIRFRLRSDGGTQREGWFVDTIRLASYTDLTPPLAVGPGGAAAKLLLSMPVPNPSRGRVGLRYSLASLSRATASVYAADGRKVRTLLDGLLPAGEGRLEWDGRAASGSRASAGLYFLRFESGGATVTRRMVLLPR